MILHQIQPCKVRRNGPDSDPKMHYGGILNYRDEHQNKDYRRFPSFYPDRSYKQPLNHLIKAQSVIPSKYVSIEIVAKRVISQFFHFCMPRAHNTNKGTVKSNV